MTDFRCKNDDLNSNPMPFQTHHECKTVLPLDLVLHPKFFVSQHTRLLPGDQLTIVRYDDKPTNVRTARPVEMVVSRVLESSREAVDLFITEHFDMTVKVLPLLDTMDTTVAEDIAEQGQTDEPAKRGPGRPRKEAA